VSAFFLLVAVASFAKGRFLGSGICLGLGIAAKVYPILSLPIFLMFLMREKLGSSLRFILGVCGSYFVVGAIPMILAQGSHAPPALPGQVSFFGGGVWGYSLEFRDIGISILLVAVVLFVFGYFLVWKPERTSILEAVICVYMLIFALTYWDTQFLLNLLPLLTVFYFTSGEKKMLFLAYMSSALAFVLLYFAFYWTSWGHSFFFIPNYNRTLQDYSDLLLFVRQWPIGGSDVSALITSPIRSIFVAVSLCYLAWILLRNSDKQVLRQVIG
jgi:hypothetical protein